MYRILIFGTGKYYRLLKHKVLNDSIIGFLDNDPAKQHRFLDGRYIYAPAEVKELEFDYVLLLSASVDDMRNQLLGFGVEDSKIINYLKCNRSLIYAETRVISEFSWKEDINCEKLIVLIGHSLTNTGAPIVLYYAAKIFQKNGYYPVIISRLEGTLQDSILWDGIPIVFNKDLCVSDLIVKVLLTTAKMIILNTLEVGWLVDECSSIGEKVVWWLHEGEPNYSEERIKECNREFSSNVKIYAVSSLAKDCFEKYSKVNRVLDILPYGIPDKGYKEKDYGEKVRFLLAGTILERKGQDVLIEAIYLLTAEELEKAEFIITGAVSDNEIYNKIINCNLSQVIYRGVLNIDDMQELYENVDVVVCPSREDPLPVVLSEGMMNKRVCIMSDHTGTASMIKDKQEGLICKAGSAESLAEQIKWVIHNPDKLAAIAQAGRKFYESVFTMEAFEKRIMSLIMPEV